MNSTLQPLRTALLLVCVCASSRADELDLVTVAPAAALDGAPLPATPGRVAQRTLLATHPLFNYQFLAAEGVLSGPGLVQETVIQTFSVSLYYNLGDSMRLTYTPSWAWYSDPAFSDSVGHQAGLSWTRGFTDWNVRASYSYGRASQPLIETGQQTTSESHNGRLAAQRTLSPRSTLELSLAYGLQNPRSFSGATTWSTSNWLHFEISPQLAASAGFAYGDTSVDIGPDMHYQRLNARLRWLVTQKLNFDLTCGWQHSVIENSPVENPRTPVYGVAAQYNPTDTTSVQVSGTRSIGPSFLAGQLNRTAAWQAAIKQRFFGKLFLDVGGSVRSSTYQSSLANSGSLRTDDGWAVFTRASIDVFERGSVGVHSAYKENSSSDTNFAFHGFQYGFDLTFRY